MAEGGNVERVSWIGPLFIKWVSTPDFLPAPKIDMETSKASWIIIYTYSAINTKNTA